MKGDLTYKDWRELKQKKRKDRRREIVNTIKDWRPWALLSQRDSDETQQETE